MSSTRVVSSHAGRWTNRRIRVSLWWIAGPIIVFLVLPTLIIIPVSFTPVDYLQFPPQSLSLKWYVELMNDPGWTSSAIFSIKIALIVAPVATVIGASAALGVVRGAVGHGSLVTALLAAPLIVPGIVYAIAVLLFLGPLHLTGTVLGFVLAHSAIAVPYAYIVVAAALYRYDVDLDLAAMACGASRLRTIWHVTLPSIAPSIVTALLLTFLTSFDDATISFFISGVTDESLPRRMFDNIEFAISPVLAAVATLLSIVTLIVVGLAIAFQIVGSRSGRPTEGKEGEG